MSEHKDPAIKLFGKTIQLLQFDQLNNQSQNIKETLEKEHDTSQSTSYVTNDDPKTPTLEKGISSRNTTKRENSNSTEKPQKPDKILPCPRCNSMDTKFCYYNNYNVNQPRHFCKNCQRYWTAGGTMRNTPVGSGRRKNKSLYSASYYRDIIVNETLKNNGSILNFGSNLPLCESMNQALNFIEKSQKPEENHSNSGSNSVEKDGNVTNLASLANLANLANLQNYPFRVPFFGPPCPYPWNSAQSGPVSFYPTPQYWGCAVQVPQTQWSMPWVTPPSDQTTSTSSLGKHSRSEEFSRDQGSENGVLRPKTLRINDLGISKDENSNSSINGGNLHKAFQSKNDEKNELDGSSLVNLQANPAAFSRSRNFQETS